MRRPRLIAPDHLSTAYYHCVSRVVNRDFVLGEAEKEHFTSLMRMYERLYGLRVLTFCVMSNHFHILVEVPKRPEEENLPSDRKLVALVRGALGDRAADELAWELKHFREQNNESAALALRERWFARMWNVSSFMKVLKQRFTQWFNGRHKRRGTLWEDRFRSVLVEGESHALKAMAAYIDLNPVRANICEDPKDYRWSGYGEAVSGGKEARRACHWLSQVSSSGGMKVKSQRPRTQAQSLASWRCFLFGLPEPVIGGSGSQKKLAVNSNEVTYRRGISKEKALTVLGAGGKLSQADYLRCRVRYFSDGAVIGGKSFLKDLLETREALLRGGDDGEERQLKKRGGHGNPLRGLSRSQDPSERIYSLRNLQKEVFS